MGAHSSKHNGGGANMNAGGSSNVTIQYTSADRTVESISPSTVISKSTYRDGVFSVQSDGNGGIVVKKLTGERTGSPNDSNSNPEYQYKTNGAYIDVGKGGFHSEYSDKRDETRASGVNWGNVAHVSGDTFKMKSELKELGFKWNAQLKRWEK